MKYNKMVAISWALAIAATNTIAQTKTGFHIIKDIPIGRTGGWDYITVDGESKRMFVSHSTQVNILSTAGDSIGVIPNGWCTWYSGDQIIRERLYQQWKSKLCFCV
ncbi:hypothetical protein [Mucilaginibacter antarcticus]|uniref:hypothetical protein n=1 Tax=Mucilaginibacter antarcticus TaxID=1855725 RepID=UPI003636E7A0